MANQQSVLAARKKPFYSITKPMMLTDEPTIATSETKNDMYKVKDLYGVKSSSNLVSNESKSFVRCWRNLNHFVR